MLIPEVDADQFVRNKQLEPSHLVDEVYDSRKT
jgi:hypothetical protein